MDDLLWKALTCAHPLLGVSWTATASYSKAFRHLALCYPDKTNDPTAAQRWATTTDGDGGSVVASKAWVEVVEAGRLGPRTVHPEVVINTQQRLYGGKDAREAFKYIYGWV